MVIVSSKPKTCIVWTCAHADPDCSNERFDWLGKLIEDIQPDYTIDLGDFHDMRSLNSYDERYPKAIVSQSYESDINQGMDAQERIWDRFKKKKKKRPYRYGIMGNHEYRIQKAINLDPRLEGEQFGISLSHLQTDYWYDEYYNYVNSAPAIVDIDGVAYSHFIASGAYGNALSGKHHGYALVERLNCSVTVGHSHEFHYYLKGDSRPTPNIGLVAGCFKGKEEDWAGQSNQKWWKGVIIKRNIEDGYYDLEQVSMRRLEKEYG